MIFETDQMDIYLNQFRAYLNQFVEISDDEWKKYGSMVRFREIKKKEIILREGEVCKEIYFTAQGLLRIYFMDQHGEEKTFHFVLEDMFAADYECFLKNTPSKFSIQAIEDSILVIMPYEMLVSGFELLKNGEKLGRMIAQEYIFIMSNKLKTIYTKSPLERYTDLIAEFPWVSRRIPQHYIASYLNISSVHLSRIKKQVVR